MNFKFKIFMSTAFFMSGCAYKTIYIKERFPTFHLNGQVKSIRYVDYRTSVASTKLDKNFFTFPGDTDEV